MSDLTVAGGPLESTHNSRVVLKCALQPAERALLAPAYTRQASCAELHHVLVR